MRWKKNVNYEYNEIHVHAEHANADLKTWRCPANYQFPTPTTSATAPPSPSSPRRSAAKL